MTGVAQHPFNLATVNAYRRQSVYVTAASNGQPRLDRLSRASLGRCLDLTLVHLTKQLDLVLLVDSSHQLSFFIITGLWEKAYRGLRRMFLIWLANGQKSVRTTADRHLWGDVLFSIAGQMRHHRRWQKAARIVMIRETTLKSRQEVFSFNVRFD
ncbi:MAG: hypothetical protein J3Q66DRAFT_57679 [Benniella sp.]|nr:MAG: hypothetical protein J3Q66DRAFT_57679 [Benniella sp.]